MLAYGLKDGIDSAMIKWGAIHFTVTQNPVTGRMRKKMGNVVFSHVFKSNTMRTKPVKVKNPKTTGQRTQRAKFKNILEIGRYMVKVVRDGFKGLAKKHSAFNEFMRENVPVAWKLVSGAYLVDFTKLLIANGNLTGLDTLTAAAASGHKINLTWVDNSGEGDALSDDIVQLIAYNEAKNSCVTDPTPQPRDQASQALTVPSSWVGDKVAVYGYAQTAKNTRNSISSFAAEVTIIT